MAEPTTTPGGCAPEAAAGVAPASSAPIAEGSERSPVVATMRTLHADRERVVEVLRSLQAAIGRGEHHLTEHGYPLSNAPRVREDLQYAIDAVSRFPSWIDVLKQVLTDSMPDHGWFVIRPSTVKAVREELAGAGELGDLVTYRVVCPSCGWRHTWEQYEREPALFDGLCRGCDTRCNGDAPAIVRGEVGGGSTG